MTSDEFRRLLGEHEKNLLELGQKLYRRQHDNALVERCQQSKRALLDTLDAADAEIERLRAFVRRIEKCNSAGDAEAIAILSHRALDTDRGADER